MDMLLQVIKDTFIPGSTTFLLIGTIVGVFLLYLNERWRRRGKIWLTALVAFYWAIGSPLGATILEKGLAGSLGTEATAEQVQGAEAIVVLGGGSINLRSRGDVVSLLVSASALRGLEGIRLYKIMDQPLVILSGGSNPKLGGGTPESQLLLEMFREAGIPEDQILLETESQSTREQAQILARRLDELDIDRFVLVTSPIHMRRSLAVFQSQGMDPIPAPSAPRSEGFEGAGIRLLPSGVALDASQEALREYLALGYYWIRGWLN